MVVFAVGRQSKGEHGEAVTVALVATSVAASWHPEDHALSVGGAATSVVRGGCQASCTASGEPRR
jgi:hypothetical protein